MIAGNEVDVVSVIFCDDIRFEMGGKVSLMGIFGPEIGVQRFPLTFRISIAILVNLETKGIKKLSTRVVGPEDVVLMQSDTSFDAIETGRNLVMPSSPCFANFQGPGCIHFEIQTEAEVWARVHSLAVSKVSDAAHVQHSLAGQISQNKRPRPTKRNFSLR